MAKKNSQSGLNYGKDDTIVQEPVECLGMTFPNDEARRAYFTEKLREKLKDPAFRKIEGFPIGDDEDILAMSDPPYYTACPNPFLRDFIKEVGRPYDASDNYHREPLAVDSQRRQDRPDLHGALLPHQGSAQVYHASHPSLHVPRRFRARRLCGFRNDRRCGADVWASRKGIQDAH